MNKAELENLAETWEYEPIAGQILSAGDTIADVFSADGLDSGMDLAGALLAAGPRLALACQSAVALAELIEQELGPLVEGSQGFMLARVCRHARALRQEARQALAQAGCAAGAGDE